MKDAIIELKGYVPEKICQRVCELTDESTEDGGQREYLRGDDINSIRLNMKKMTTMKSQNKWTPLVKQFAAGMKTAYSKWCENTGEKPLDKISLEVPEVFRYDPVCGKHNATVFKDKRILTVIFYMNDIKDGGETFFDVDGKKFGIQAKMGNAIAFPADEKFKWKDTASRKYMKYTIKGYIIKP